MNNKSFATVFAILWLAAASAFAQTGFTFLEIPVGARESALGGAGVALVSGPTSAAHNPAALSRSRYTSFAAMTTRHFGDTRAQFFSLNMRTKSLAFAPHFWGTRVPDVELRDAPSLEPIDLFDVTFSAVGVASSWSLNEKLSFGATIRYLHSKIYTESSEGWATDFGALWSTPVKALTLGAAVNHLGNVNSYANEDVTLPTTLRLGGAYDYSFGQAGNLLFTAEGDAVNENTPNFRGGLEYRAPEFLALRAGYVTGLETQGLSFGAGLSYRRFALDYAFLPYKEELGEGHRLGFRIDF